MLGEDRVESNPNPNVKGHHEYIAVSYVDHKETGDVSSFCCNNVI